jgi:hypothetical protein
MTTHHHRVATFVLCVALAFAAACGAAKTSTSNPPTSGNGQLAVVLVDAPGNAKEVWVGITKITAHSTADGWVTVYTPNPSPYKVDLLTLQNGASLPLGSVNLKPATITQVRLYVSTDAADNYVILQDGTKVPLKVPSGVQTGIKIIGPFEIGECNTTTLTLDFDGKHSIFTHPTGTGDEWILRPTIHTAKSSVDFVGCAPPLPPPSGPIACGPTLPACATGDQCINGTCAGPAGSACISALECISGACDPNNTCDAKGGAGAPCTPDDNGADCLSGTCAVATEATQGTCAQSAPTDPCRQNADCTSNSCDLVNGVCNGTQCTLGAVGATCTSMDCCQQPTTGSVDCLAPASGTGPSVCTVVTVPRAM